MLQIAYTSRVCTPLSHAEYHALVEQAQRRNRQDAITGLLLYDGVRFMQAFEGPAELADTCMARIAADPRHEAVVISGREHVTNREFGNFAMAAMMPGQISASEFPDRVKELVRGVSSAHLQALFIGFAIMSRAKQPIGPRSAIEPAS